MRETYLERYLQRLLDCPELNLDRCEEETWAAVAEAAGVLNTPALSDLGELEHTVVYIGEQVEMFRSVLERLCDEVAGPKKGLDGKRPAQRGSSSAASMTDGLGTVPGRGLCLPGALLRPASR